MKKIAFYFTLFPIFIFAYSNISSNCCYDHKRFSTYGDYLFWKTEEDGLDFIYDDRINNSNNNGLNGDIRRARYEWQSGFRIGFQYKFGRCDDWILDTQYGFIGPKATQKIINAENKQMSSTFQMPSNNFVIQKAFTRTRICSNFANILLERNIKCCPKFNMTFLSGLSWIWIKRDWLLKFTDATDLTRVIVPTWHYKGAGLKTGFDFDWTIKGNFHWSGRSCIAAIYGNYDIWMKAYDLPSNIVFENSHLDDFRIVTNFQFLLGPSWQKCFCNSIFKIFLNLEINVWQNLSQTNRSQYQTSSSNPQSRFTKNNLQMYGLTLDASLNF